MKRFHEERKWITWFGPFHLGKFISLLHTNYKIYYTVLEFDVDTSKNVSLLQSLLLFCWSILESKIRSSHSTGQGFPGTYGQLLNHYFKIALLNKRAVTWNKERCRPMFIQPAINGKQRGLFFFFSLRATSWKCHHVYCASERRAPTINVYKFKLSCKILDLNL